MNATLKRPKLTEAQVTKQIVMWMELRGYRAERQNSGLASFGVRGKVRYGTVGGADYIFTHPGKPTVYIEIKREGEVIRPITEIAIALMKSPDSKALRHELKQAEYLEARRAEGFSAFWANSLEMLEKEMSR